MQKCIMNLPTMKEIEVKLFQQLQRIFSEAMVSHLEEMDQWIMENRDTARYRMRDLREVTISTTFGEITFKRRLYQDRHQGSHVYLLDQALAFDGQSGISPRLEEWAVELATIGPSYAEAAKQIETLLGYQAISHETIRQCLIKRSEEAARFVPSQKKKAEVLFVEVDGLYTKLQRKKGRGKENKLATIHEGWDRNGKRVNLRNKTYYHHRGNGDTFWEGFGDFLIEHYDVDENTWLVVNGDGASWINECTSYFHRCIYTLDRFHVARDIKHYLHDLPMHLKAARKALADYDPHGLIAAIESVSVEGIREDWREDWERFKAFLHRHKDHLIDYRTVLKDNGVDTASMRPMGSAESQMRVFAKRTKRGGYSWSVRGVEAMLGSIIIRKEGRSLFSSNEVRSQAQESISSPFRLQQLFKKPKNLANGVIDGLIRTLHGPTQNRPLGMALKGLRG